MAGRFGISAVYSIVTLHTAEMFPTSIRNSALGTCSTMSHVGSIAAPYVVDFLVNKQLILFIKHHYYFNENCAFRQGKIAWFIPTTICGSLIIVAGLLCLTHPETKSKELTDHA